MGEGAVDALCAGDLRIDVDELPSPPGLVLRWSGRSAERYPGRTLGPFFGEVLARAEAIGAEVELRFHALEHFNSSTITTVIELIQDARRRGVRLVVAYDASLKWQRLCFDALRVFVQGDALLELRPSAGVGTP